MTSLKKDENGRYRIWMGVAVSRDSIGVKFKVFDYEPLIEDLMEEFGCEEEDCAIVHMPIYTKEDSEKLKEERKLTSILGDGGGYVN